MTGSEEMPAALKLYMVLIALLFCVLPGSLWVCVYFIFAVPVFLLYGKKVRPSVYLKRVTVPAAFLAAGFFALLLEYGKMDGALLTVPFFADYITVTAQSLQRAVTVSIKAAGAVSCLSFLGLTTSMEKLIGVFRKLRIPEVIISLMYLICRYISILFSVHETMKESARGRLGYKDAKTGIRTTGKIYAALLAVSYKKTGQMYDAMESRCFDGKISFLQKERRTKPGDCGKVILFLFPPFMMLIYALCTHL